jgi:AcrR family transcriptional regulator
MSLTSEPVARTEKYERERHEILQAAYRLIGRSPGSTVQIGELLETAGLSTRAFYRHFRSKDELILTMYRTAAERFAAELSDVVAQADGAMAELEAWIRHQLAAAYDVRRARQASVLSSPEARAAVGFDQANQAGETMRRTILAEVIRRGRRDGTFPLAGNPDEDARAILGAVGAVVMAKLAGEPVPSWSEATTHMTTLFLRAFGAAPAGLQQG